MTTKTLKRLDAPTRRSGVNAKSMSYNDIQVIASRIIDVLPSATATERSKRSETPRSPSKIETIRRSLLQFCCCIPPIADDDLDDSPKRQNDDLLADKALNADLAKKREAKKGEFGDNILEVALEKVISLDPVFKLVGKSNNSRPDGRGPSSSSSRFSFQ